MGLEIERKFLVRSLPLLPETRRSFIDQAYLSTAPQSVVRVRSESFRDAGNRYVELGFITVKGLSRGATRPEYEYLIPHPDAVAMISSMSQHRVRKTRIYTPYAGHTWEVDVFHDDNEGLIIAEVELESEHEVVSIPPWADTELTNDARYSNLSLGVNPWRLW